MITPAQYFIRFLFQDSKLDSTARRASCMTLLHPEYGDSDSDEFEEDNAKKFFIPADDEEELLDELNELTPESLHVSTKILGQGMFYFIQAVVL